MLYHSTKNSSVTVQYTTRVASTNDAEILVDIGIKTFRDTFGSENTAANMRSYLEKTFTVDQIRKDLADTRCTYMLLYDNHRVIGYAKLMKGDSDPNEPRKIEIERIYAIEEYIGKKAGQTLMQTCLDFAQRDGYSKVWLGVWEHNARAIAFYEKWGFKKVGTHPFLLGDDLQTDLVMEKMLD
jgi:ribosomal protein S18 acetylase RimI-like enzyme